MKQDMSVYFSGQRLYGDDFSANQIKEWFRDEEEGYATLGASNKESYKYQYHKLNIYHGYNYLKKKRFKNALGIGSAYGDEFEPIATMIDYITILDPSNAFSNVHQILETPCKYIKPNSDGNMPFDSNSFDLITSFGVLHHIPNVTHVMKECYRCLNNGATMLVREPIVSMGDWTKPRPGLTKRERGIPFRVFNDIINETGFKIKKKSLFGFRVVPILASKIGISAYNNLFFTISDGLMCRMFYWNKRYHRKRIYQKFGPTGVFFILEKR